MHYNGVCMSTLQIKKYGEAVLAEKSAEIKQITPEIKNLIKQMFETMYNALGVGLAANQVGYALSLCVIDTSASGKKCPMVFINPKIEKREGVLHEEEGCLSFPGIYKKIKRSKKIRVRALDENGAQFVIDAENMLSRALQHEIDHLNGKLLIDNLPPLQKQEVKKEIEIRKQENKW